MPERLARHDAAMGVRLVGRHVAGLAMDLDPGLPQVEATAASAEQLLERWDAARDPAPVLDRRFRDGRAYLRVWRDATGAYRVWTPDIGDHVVEAGGTAVMSVPPLDADGWAGRRLEVAQVLPLLAVLNGREVLHAGAVVVDGRLIAVSAAAGTGKSSTLARMIAAGASFQADDVLALTRAADGQVVGHPGPRLLNLHAHEIDALGVAAADLGRRIGETDKVHLEPPPLPVQARRMRAVVLLDRAEHYPVGSIEAVPQPAMHLLGSAYGGYYDHPDRLRNQLDIVDALVAQVPVVRLRVGVDEPPVAVAERLSEWASSL